MLKFLFNRKDYFQKENEKMMKDLYRKMEQLNRIEKYRTRMILDYIFRSLETTNVQLYFHSVFSESEAFGESEKMQRILEQQNALIQQKFIYWLDGKEYTIKGVAIPMMEVYDYESFQDIQHTEDEMLYRIYYYGDYYYHECNDEVLVIYSDGQEDYAMPYEVFFAIIKDDNGAFIPRFRRIIM